MNLVQNGANSCRCNYIDTARKKFIVHWKFDHLFTRHRVQYSQSATEKTVEIDAK